MRTKAARFIHFGPSIPVVPVKDFSRLPFNRVEMERVWEVCGPSVERNLMQGLPMWQIITAAYLEGLSHGSALERERDPINAYKEVPINGKHPKRRSASSKSVRTNL